MVRRISIILLILVALAGPASAGVVVFSLVAYFGNFGDKVNPIKENNLGSGLKSTCTEIPEPIRTYISNAAKQVGMPATFIAATAKKESSFNQKAQSQYAGGVMQLANIEAYDTYDELHTTYKSQYKGTTKFTGNRNTDIYLAEYNIYLGAQYTRKLHDQFIDKAKGDKLLELVAAAYNGGPTGLANAGYDYTKMVEETRNYVPKVMEFYRQFEATCKEDLTLNISSEHGSKIAESAKQKVGTGSTCYNSDKNNACAAFTSAVVNPIAGTHLGNLVPINWSSNEGTRINDRSKLEPGDLVYWSGSSTFQPGDNSSDNPTFFKPGDIIPSHVGVYVGQYSGSDGKANGQTVTYKDAVIHNSGSNSSIIVTRIGVRTFFGAKRY